MGRTVPLFAAAGLTCWFVELDGTPVAVTGSRDGTVRVWDLNIGTLRATLIGHTNGVFAVACTVLDGTPIAVTGSGDGTGAGVGPERE